MEREPQISTRYDRLQESEEKESIPPNLDPADIEEMRGELDQVIQRMRDDPNVLEKVTRLNVSLSFSRLFAGKRHLGEMCSADITSLARSL